MSSAPPRLSPDDLDWEEPATRATGQTAELIGQVGDMRHALSARRGSWAVLATFEKPQGASSSANTLQKRRDAGESRLIGCEFAGRKMLDGGSKLYVRAKPA